MKKIICGVIALLVGIMAFAETIDNKPTQNNTLLNIKKGRLFIFMMKVETLLIR